MASINPTEINPPIIPAADDLAKLTPLLHGSSGVAELRERLTITAV